MQVDFYFFYTEFVKRIDSDTLWSILYEVFLFYFQS